MVESTELKKVKNGYIVTVNYDEDEPCEYVFDNIRKSLKFLKDLLDPKAPE